MRRYESVVVISSELGEARVKEEIAKVQTFIEAHHGKNVKIDKWGGKDVGSRNRKPIIGQYFCLSYESDSSGLMDALVGMLRINDAVLKFQSFRINEKVRKVKTRIKKPAEVSAGADVDVPSY